MIESKHQLPWTQTGWIAPVTEWIHAQLERQGLRVNGAIEQPHIRAWSTVLRVPTLAGDLYFKAVAPLLAHEPPLVAALARWRPDVTPELLAVDAVRGWMLMRSSGVSLRSLLKADGDLRRWETILPQYAQLQMELAPRRDELLALGVLDRRLAILPERYAQLLADTEALLIGQSNGLTGDEHQRLLAFGPRLTEMCRQLADYALPESLDHNDFHDANIFVRDGRYTFVDWGDSCLTHPFSTLVVTLRNVAFTLGLPPDAPALFRLRDVYLEPWTRFEPRARVLEAFRLAHRVGMLNRALTWHLSVSNAPEPFRAEDADAVPGWLQEFLNGDAVPYV